MKDFISDKMTEENKKNDDAEVKQTLPEFKVTVKKEETKEDVKTENEDPQRSKISS